MKQSLFILLLIIVNALNTYSSTYYFSSSTGNDSYTAQQAQNPDTPWKTIDQLNASMNLINPGDNILFKRGDTFIGQIILTRSGTTNNHIVFGAYGDGPAPIITGAKPITNWTNTSGNIWVASCPQLETIVTNLFINGASQQIGRYPNADAPNSGYLNIDAHFGQSSITSYSLSSSPDLTGGIAVVRTRHWILERLPIESIAENSLFFGIPASIEIHDNYGFFIQNHINTLDNNGEWFYDKMNNKMYLFYSIDPNSIETEATAFSSIFETHNQNYFMIENIQFKCSSKCNILVENSNNVEITNSFISNAGNDAVFFEGCKSVRFIDNTISQINNNAVFFKKCRNLVVKNNIIRKVGLRPGMGSFSLNQYTGLFLGASISHCESNTIDSVGYNGIIFAGDTVLIKDNYINHFCMTLEDGGGIYTYNEQNTVHQSRKLENNIIVNGIGAVDGTLASGMSLARGIFFDYGSDHIIAIGNTVANCAGAGIFITFSNHISLFGNTVFNNFKQLVFKYSEHSLPLPITNCIVQNNIFYSKLESQLVAEFQGINRNDISKFGYFDYNYYCRPLNESQKIRLIYSGLSGIEIELLNLSTWQQTFNNDMNSKSSPYQLPIYNVVDTGGSNKIINSTLDNDFSNWYCWSNYNNCNITWDNSNKLDDGSLKLNFSTLSGKKDAHMNGVAYIGEIIPDKKYLLKLSLTSTHPEKMIVVSMRKDSDPYILASDHYIIANTNRIDYELLFEPDIGDDNAMIYLMISEDDESYWFDNVELYQSNIQISSNEDSILFLYNAQNTAKMIVDGKYYVDPKGNKYYNSYLQPFSSLILLKVTDDYFQSNPEPKQDIFIILYPNPSNNIVNILTNYNNNKTIQIIDLAGNIVYELESLSDYMSVDISTLSKGLYIAKLSGDNGIVSAKFIVM